MLEGYLARGWGVIPCWGKKPALPTGSPYRHTERATPPQLGIWAEQQRGCFWGVVTGKLSSITVVDIDTEEGRTWWKAHQPKAHPFATVKTPHGWHLYFPYNPRVGNHVRPQPGIDVRNDGGYVVAPPSLGYAWLK